MTAPSRPRKRGFVPTSRTQYAILGVLASGPRSGYDIKKDVAERISHFWNESLGHLYPVLDQLLRLGLVTRSSERDAPRPTRHVYTITAAGREALERWLREPVVASPPRLEILLKTYFGSHVPPEVLTGHIAAYRAERERQLATLEAVHAMLSTANGESRYLRLTVRAGVLAARSALAWCDEALAEQALVRHETDR